MEILWIWWSKWFELNNFGIAVGTRFGGIADGTRFGGIADGYTLVVIFYY